MSSMTRITPIIAGILEQCRVEGSLVFLPGELLDRPTYLAVNKVLEALGGKWNRKAKAHIFPDDPSEYLDAALSSGYAIDQRKLLDAFYTPEPVVTQLIEAVHLEAQHYTLEPSCGDGAIVGGLLKVVPAVDVCEIDDNALDRIVERYGTRHVRQVARDFLTFDPHAYYDRIVANPPFSKRQDVVHVNHMLDILKPRGQLAVIMGGSFEYSQDRRAQALRERLSAEGVWGTKALPDGAFRSSGTMVHTVLLTLTKRGEVSQR